MNIHEYQAKALLREHGVRVPRGRVAYTPEEAEEAARELGGGLWVVKAQIHAGGRGKAGGVQRARSLAEVRQRAGDLLGRRLVTPQTGPAGRLVKRVLVEEGVAIARELYLGCLVDRGTGRVTFMASKEGGVEIEEVAATRPEAIVKVAVDPATGFMPHHGRRLAFALGLRDGLLRKAVALFQGVHDCLVARDASLVEINPLIVTEEGELVALDAKIAFDDNGLFRQPQILELRDLDEEDPMEVEASRHDLSYVKLDGNIGCMVNGAGLAMATMDIIKLYGGEPANFLDVGGGANRDKVAAAFRLLLSDPNVEAVLVNIFGGIMRCDVIAEGIVAAAREVNLTLPLVVRLEGTNVELGKSILAESGLSIIPADDLAEAAEKAVAAVRGAS